MQRIIFIDIDGPIINTPCYWIDIAAGLDRSVLNTQAIGIINQIAIKANAKIVTNSTHNTHTVRSTGRNLRDDLIKWGMKEEYFHDDWKTEYPWPKDMRDSNDPTAIILEHRRMAAIKQWQEKNGDADWIAFDDDKFIDSERLFLIDFNNGICYEEYIKVKEYWKFDDKDFILG